MRMKNPTDAGIQRWVVEDRLHLCIHSIPDIQPLSEIARLWREDSVSVID